MILRCFLKLIFIVIVFFHFTMPVQSKPLHHMQIYLHLGDGPTSEHFMFIKDKLRFNKGSIAETNKVQAQEIESLKNGEKSPSSSVGESEYSHLLDLIRKYRKQHGVAIFNLYGLKVGLAGYQSDGIVLSEKISNQLKAMKDGQQLIISYKCSKSGLDFKSCNKSTSKIYRGIWSFNNKSPILIGYSLVLADIK